MGINVWALVLLVIGGGLAAAEFFKTKRLGDLALTFLSAGIAVAFYASASEPLLHP